MSNAPEVLTGPRKPPRSVILHAPEKPPEWNLTDVEAAYLAGLFDGEGSVTFRYYKTKPRMRAAFFRSNFQIRISNTNYPTIKWLHQTFGGLIIRGKQYPTNPVKNMKTGYQWQLTANPFKFLHAIQPYLRIKRERVDLILSYESLKTKKGPRSSEEKKKLQWIAQRSRDYNR